MKPSKELPNTETHEEKVRRFCGGIEWEFARRIAEQIARESPGEITRGILKEIQKEIFEEIQGF